MKAEVEPITGMVRVWKEPDKGYGDPYDWVALVKWIDPTSVELSGQTDQLTPGIYKALKRELIRKGVKHVMVATYKDRVRRERWIDIS